MVKNKNVKFNLVFMAGFWNDIVNSWSNDWKAKQYKSFWEPGNQIS
jgi:hypothetical protein